MGDREFYVIKFKNAPVCALNFLHICVPKIWIKNPYDGLLSKSRTVVVETRYPIDDTRNIYNLVKQYKECTDQIYYEAYVKHKTYDYGEAMSLVKELNARETSPIPSTSTAARDQGYSQTVKSDEHSIESAVNLLYEAEHNNTDLIRTVAEDVQILKEHITEKFDILFALVEQLRMANSSSILNLQQDLTKSLCCLSSTVERLEKSRSGITGQPNSPAIVGAAANAPTEVTQENIKENEIDNELRAVEINDIDISIATTAKHAALSAAVENNESSSCRMEANDTHADEDLESDDEDSTDVATVDMGGPPRTSVVTREVLTPERERMKRKPSDTDAILPVKKRDDYGEAMSLVKELNGRETSPIPSTSTAVQDQGYSQTVKSNEDSIESAINLLYEAEHNNTDLIRTVAEDVQILKEHITEKFDILFALVEQLRMANSSSILNLQQDLTTSLCYLSSKVDRLDNESRAVEINNIDISIANTSKNAVLSAAVENDVRSSCRMEANYTHADADLESDDEDSTDVATVDMGGTPRTSVVTREVLTPERERMKRKPSDTDPILPVKKRGGLSNH